MRETGTVILVGDGIARVYGLRECMASELLEFEDGSFGPDKNVSRQDAVLMIYRAMNLITELPEGYKFFADEKDIQDYASMAIRTLGDLGIITGNGKKNEFLPNNDITRAEMAVLMNRFLAMVDERFSIMTKVMNEKLEG